MSDTKMRMSRKGVTRTVLDTMRIRSVILLAGYVKSGKTYVLKQVESSLMEYKDSYKVEYHDFRSMDQSESEELMLKISDSIINSHNIIYLIDNVTYAQYPDLMVQAICGDAYEYRDTSTRVVFAGNRNVMNNWNRFYDMESYITVNYMTYDEWELLVGHGVSNGGYERYIDTIDEFHRITDMKGFLERCLEEAETASKTSMNVLYNNDYSGLTAENLLNTLYSVIFCIYERFKSETLLGIELFDSSMNYEMMTLLKAEKFIKRRIRLLLSRRYERFKEFTEEDFKNAMIFLYVNGIIQISDVGDEEESTVHRLLNDCFNSDSCTDFKSGFFRDYNVLFRHPIFFSALMKRIISD